MKKLEANLFALKHAGWVAIAMSGPCYFKLAVGYTPELAGMNLSVRWDSHENHRLFSVYEAMGIALADQLGFVK